jgi:hypothetical protein
LLIHISYGENDDAYPGYPHSRRSQSGADVTVCVELPDLPEPVLLSVTLLVNAPESLEYVKAHGGRCSGALDDCRRPKLVDSRSQDQVRERCEDAVHGAECMHLRTRPEGRATDAQLDALASIEVTLTALEAGLTGGTVGWRRQVVPQPSHIDTVTDGQAGPRRA